MRSLFALFVIAILLFSNNAYGQYYETGQDPASLKWMQIRTGHFTVIFPGDYSSRAIEFAKVLDEASASLGTLYPGTKARIPVIIHNYTTQSNGYVAWAPRRMELYPTPEQNTIPLNQDKQLAIHELAHVMQMQSLVKGFSGGMTYLFGEQFTGLIAAMLPEWFLEGNAVLAETALTESGRGRSPSFQKQFKALAVENGKVFKYDKIANGSYRDFVPDIYQSGFQSVTWAMVKYDPHIWNKVLDYTAKNPFTLNPVNFSLRKNAGLTKKRLSNETFDTLTTVWKKEITDKNPEIYQPLNPSKKGKYISYYCPVNAGADSIIAIRTALSEAPSFVLLNERTKTEKKLHTPGYMYPWFISYAAGRLVWVEMQNDPRWENRNYSVIKLLDLKTGTARRLTSKSRYVAAALSPDGNMVAAVENTPENVSRLVLINANSGIVVASAPSPGNIFLQRPQWSGSGDKITLIYLSGDNEGITSWSVKTAAWETILEPGRADIQSAFLQNDSLFFVSSASGTDNVYLKSPGRKIIQATQSAFGVTDINPAAGRLLFSDYSSSGNNLCSIDLKNLPGNLLEHEYPESFLINRFKEEPVPEAGKPAQQYTVEPYRKWKHLFRFHSWMPFYADIEELKTDPTAVRPGISLMTQNNLSTLISTIGYEYSENHEHLFHTRIQWKGWYPMLESQIDYGGTPSIIKSTGNADPTSVNPGFRFINTISLPLTFSSGKFSEFLQPSLSSDYRNDYVYIKETSSYDNGQNIVSARLYFSNYHRSAYRSIYPQWAQVIDFNYSFAPADKNIYGTSASLNGSLYFPGLFADNGIRLRYGREKQQVEKFLYSSRVKLPRGYKDIIPSNITFLSADYVMPIAYPDFNIAALFYLKRLRGGLFYDYAEGPGNSFYQHTSKGLSPVYNSSETASFSSFGIELLADFHLLRVPYMISAGVQSAWKQFGSAPAVELLFNIDLYGMNIGGRKIR